jgi:hypothetical protein
MDVTLLDGRVAHCVEAQAQEYQNCKISAGLVDGIEPDTVYFRFQKEQDEPTYFFLRPDEATALIYCLSGAVWSGQIQRLLK